MNADRDRDGFAWAADPFEDLLACLGDILNGLSCRCVGANREYDGYPPVVHIVHDEDGTPGLLIEHEPGCTAPGRFP